MLTWRTNQTIAQYALFWNRSLWKSSARHSRRSRSISKRKSQTWPTLSLRSQKNPSRVSWMQTRSKLLWKPLWTVWVHWREKYVPFFGWQNLGCKTNLHQKNVWLTTLDYFVKQTIAQGNTRRGVPVFTENKSPSATPARIHCHPNAWLWWIWPMESCATEPHSDWLYASRRLQRDGLLPSQEREYGGMCMMLLPLLYENENSFGLYVDSFNSLSSP